MPHPNGIGGQIFKLTSKNNLYTHNKAQALLCVYCCMLTLKNPNLTTNVYSGTFFSRMGFFSCPMWFSSFHSLCFALHMLEEGWGMWC